MPTIYIAIGNSDDKLSQAAWSAFAGEVASAVRQAADLASGRVHFAGFSAPAAPWQNAMWALELPAGDDAEDALRARLSRLAGTYAQDSIAWARADRVDFLPGAPT